MAKKSDVEALQRELAVARAERDEAQAQQAAVAEVLRAINASQGNLQPVFDLITERAMTMCDADGADLLAIKDGFATSLAMRNPTPVQVEFWKKPFDLSQGASRLQDDPQTIHHVDMAETDVYKARKPLAVMAVEGARMRTLVQVPLTGEGGLIGQFALFRRKVRPFSARQIALVEAFAAQAALAIENARLLTEQREALEQQTASAGVLRVISQSPTDVQPVFDSIAESALRLLNGWSIIVWRYEGGRLHPGAIKGGHAGSDEAIRRLLEGISPDDGFVGDAIHKGTVQQIVDVEAEGADPRLRELGRLRGWRSNLAVPMMREGQPVGVFTLARTEPGAFSEREVRLLQSFADQAVIAVENVRLFTELREALDQQTASAEILRVISQSPTDVNPVLTAVVRAALRFCAAEDAGIVLRQDNHWEGVAHEGPMAWPTGRPVPLDREHSVGRALLDGKVVHMPDAEALDPVEYALDRKIAERIGFRAALIAPMLHEGRAIGAIILHRRDPAAFPPRQVELLEAFAAQAVIAVENVRLFTELGMRNKELSESLEQQTATADILRVISQSPTDVQPVLAAVAKAALRFCGAEDVVIALRDGDIWTAAGHQGAMPGQLGERYPLNRETAPGRAIVDAQLVHLPSIADLDPVEFAAAHHLSRQYGFRAAVAAPMLRDGTAIGSIALRKAQVGAYSPRQIALLESFAAQAVIAIENVRLFTELRESLEQQTATSDILRVISQSPTNVQPVLDAIAQAALRFCGGEDVFIALHDGDTWVNSGHAGSLPGTTGGRQKLNRETAAGWAILDGETVHFPDIRALDPVEHANAIRISHMIGHRAVVAAPMLRKGVALGAIVLRKLEVGPFSPRQIALLESFAAQAVIAFENTRLFTELRESLEQQTATTEILQAINRSPGELHPVFDAIVEKAMMLCDAAFGTFATFDGQTLHTAVTRGVPEAFTRFRLSNPPDYGPGTGPGRLIAGEDCVHDIDGADSEAYRRGDPNRRAIVDLGGARTILNVALRKDSALLGVISIYRQQVRPFSDKQIALLQAFAAQAVIAMENARLLGELRQRTDDLTESLEYQTATSEVLEAIGRSTSDIQPVLDTMLKAALRLCRTESGGVAIQQGDAFRYIATLGWDPPTDMAIRARRIVPARGMIGDRTLLERKVVEIRDVETDPDFPLPQIAGGFHTALGVPLLRDGEPIGVITLTRRKLEPFTARQIALIKTFADQAVIAMENARLLGELTRREEELRVTFDHMGDGVVMFDANLKLASWNRNFQELLDVPDSFLASRPVLDDYVRLLVNRGEVGQGDGAHEVARYRERANQQWSTERTRPDGRILEVRNNPVPGGGAVLIYSDITERKKAEAEIAAARDAAEAALERQTATADILKVIASSPTDVQPVLDAVAKAAVQFCGTTDALVQVRDGNEAIVAAHEGPLGAPLGRRIPLDGGSAFGAAILEHRTIHLPDMDALDAAKYAGTRARAAEFGFRALISAPLLREDTAVGAISLRRIEPGAFTDQQIELLETFAAQAVIAIENVRLFNDLRESLDQQTATAEILRAISQSPTDVQPVLDAVAKAAVRFCGAVDALICLREGESWIATAHEGPMGHVPGERSPLNRENAIGRAIIDGLTCHLPDVATLDPVEFATVQHFAEKFGFRAVVAAPLLRDGVAIGSVGLRKPEPGPFTPAQISLLETFAAQAVIAIENVRLFTELRDSLERLKAAQANLVQSEKMATLGQLTAGIAHEIKNPLNFVNNFASLSVELLGELKEIAGPALETLDGERRAEVDETMSLLTSNLGKITEHGKRADGIVKSMLSHSRGGSGDWQASDINALVEEALNLAYHGARAQDKEFNVTLERDFQKTSQPIEVVPQDVTRVFLNLFGNGFYAANKRRMSAKEAGFRPTLKVSTHDLGEAVEVRVRDNGTGIAPAVRDKLFQPFFTTKPTGEGTGLGLSISYDIVTQQHGGTIEVTSEVGQYTEFTVRLPRSRRVSAERA